MEDFKEGDIVVLKSDADSDFPLLMTINAIEGNEVSCIWRVPTKPEFKGQMFPKAVLVKYEE